MKLPVLRKSESGAPTSSGEDAQLLEARRRAATLMGGEAPGGQGEVRVWAPSKRWTRRRMKRASLDILEWVCFLVPLWALAHLHPNGLAFALFVPLFGSAISMNIRRPCRQSFNAYQFQNPPCYISADDDGIAFAQWSNSRSISWSDVIALKSFGRFEPTYLELHTRSHGHEGMSLDGYAPEDIESVELFICFCASLVYRPLFGFYARPDETSESLRAAGAVRSLSKPCEGAPSEASTESRPGTFGLR